MNTNTKDKDYAFVEITFSKETKDYFSNLIYQIVPKGFLYYSPVIERIKGSMANTLHCTLFYGLETESIKNSDLKELINKANTNIQEIKLGDLFFIKGYQNLYKVLCIEVLDLDNRLKHISEIIATFARGVEYEFKPHLTLAYVTNEYEILDKMPEIRRDLGVEEIRISLSLGL